MPDDNGWSEWSKHVLSELERLNTVAERLEERHGALRTTQETIRVEVANLRDNCAAGFERIETNQKELERHYRERTVERTRQDREDERANRKGTITLVVCVVSALAAVASAVVTAISNVMQSTP